MLAMALEADATEHDHLVIALDFLEGLLQNQCGILTISGEKFLEGTSNASGSFDQSGSLRIVARPSNNRPERRFDIGSAGPTDIDPFRALPSSSACTFELMEMFPRYYPGRAGIGHDQVR
jgi:hypothetical protein